MDPMLEMKKYTITLFLALLLVGSTVYIKTKSGARYKGKVIAETAGSITLETFRFGDWHNLTIEKRNILAIARKKGGTGQ